MVKKDNVLIKVDNLDLKIYSKDEIWESVTKIGEYAFSYCTEFKSIDIPDSVIEIGPCAFEWCTNLTSVDIPDSVTKIGRKAFQDCRSLKKVTIGNSVTEIGSGAFCDCHALKELTIGKSVKEIGNYAFQNCIRLASVDIPDSVTEIPAGLFWECGNLTEANLGKSTKVIGANAFFECKKLQTVNIPNSVIEIGEKAFYGCESLTLINWSKSLTKIGQLAFQGCINLTEVEMSDSVTALGEYAFSDCFNLKKAKVSKNVTSMVRTFNRCFSLEEVILQEGLLEIGLYAFYCCEKLKTIKIPETVEKIGSCAFQYCDALKQVTIPQNVKKIGSYAFNHCSSLEKINFNEGLVEIGNGAFNNCNFLEEVILPKSVKKIGQYAFYDCHFLKTIKMPADVLLEENSIPAHFGFFYLSLKSNEMIFTTKKIDLSKGEYLKFEINDITLSANYRVNLIKVLNMKKDGKVKFIPPEYTLSTFPPGLIEDYFVNNNHHRWGKLVKTLGFNLLEEQEKYNSLSDLMKIYYAIGGFSDNQGESEKAFDYVLKHVAQFNDETYSAQEAGARIHERFSALLITEKFNPTFAEFFMKYYHENNDFMVFTLKDEHGDLMPEQDYLCVAHNKFSHIKKSYPHRTVNGNDRNALFTPKFVAEHSSVVIYENVHEGNEALATLVGRYGYTQEQFEHIQQVYNKAKLIKDKFVISADRAKGENGITFRVLDKDDELGFVLGDITNCCQRIGSQGASCVDDGYLNPDAGFIVFEETVKDKNGNDTGEKRILGQAYIWYDPETKTVCFDNIEIPRTVLKRLRSGEKSTEDDLSTTKLLETVVESADAIISSMNERGIEVKRVTTGAGYNDLNRELQERFGAPDKKPIAKHRSYSGYTDAKEQYLIREYDKTTREKADSIKLLIEEVNENFQQIESNMQELEF